MKKSIFILFITIISFAGITHAQDSPRTVVGKYLEAVRNNDYDTAYSFISKTDTTIIDWLRLLKYIREIAPPKLSQIINLAHGSTEQEILSVSTNDNTSVVKIHSTVPDMEKTLSIIQKPDDIQFLISQGGLPMKEKIGECTLVIEDGLWKISKIKGVASSQAADIAMDFATLILGKEDAKLIGEKIDAFMKKQEDDV